MRAMIILGLALPIMAQAAPMAYYFDLSGDQFVQMMSHPEPLSPEHYMDREKAYSYLDGAKDAMIGTAWCPLRARKTFELAYDAADYIKTIPTERRKKNAAVLLLEFLGRQYPCARAHQ